MGVFLVDTRHLESSMPSREASRHSGTRDVAGEELRVQFGNGPGASSHATSVDYPRNLPHSSSSPRHHVACPQHSPDHNL
jgi:hypothetical protein